MEETLPPGRHISTAGRPLPTRPIRGQLSSRIIDEEGAGVLSRWFHLIFFFFRFPRLFPGVRQWSEWRSSGYLVDHQQNLEINENSTDEGRGLCWWMRWRDPRQVSAALIKLRLRKFGRRQFGLSNERGKFCRLERGCQAVFSVVEIHIYRSGGDIKTKVKRRLFIFRFYAAEQTKESYAIAHVYGRIYNQSFRFVFIAGRENFPRSWFALGWRCRTDEIAACRNPAPPCYMDALLFPFLDICFRRRRRTKWFPPRSASSFQFRINRPEKQSAREIVSWFNVDDDPHQIGPLYVQAKLKTQKMRNWKSCDVYTSDTGS